MKASRVHAFAITLLLLAAVTPAGAGQAGAAQTRAALAAGAVSPAVSPAPVSSPQDMPGPALPTPDPAQIQATIQVFDRIRAQQEQLQTQTRAQMLAALSPDRRRLVASLIGELAVAPNPDPVITAGQLDVLLTPSEQQTILRLNASEQAQRNAIGQAMRAAIERQLPPEQRDQMQRQVAQMKADLEKKLTPEQRQAMEHTPVPTLAPIMMSSGASGAMMYSSAAATLDAGGILLRTLATPILSPQMSGQFRSNRSTIELFRSQP